MVSHVAAWWHGFEARMPQLPLDRHDDEPYYFGTGPRGRILLQPSGIISTFQISVISNSLVTELRNYLRQLHIVAILASRRSCGASNSAKSWDQLLVHKTSEVIVPITGFAKVRCLQIRFIVEGQMQIRVLC